MGITAARQTGTPAAVKAFLVLFLDGCFLPVLGVCTAPRCAEGWIFNQEAHLHAGEAVFLQGVSVLEIVGVLAFDQHFCKADSVRLAHKLLPEQPNIRRRIEMTDITVGGGQHTAGAASLGRTQ